MITKAQAMRMRPGMVLHHASFTNADGSPVSATARAMCNGWEDRPGEFILPMEYSWGESFNITPLNAKHWGNPEMRRQPCKR